MDSQSLVVLLTVVTFVLMWVPNSLFWKTSYATLAITGLLTEAFFPTAFASMAILGALLIVYKNEGRFSLVAGFVALLLGLALGLHVVPGFNNVEYASDIRLSQSAAAFDIWFNFDKSLFGLFVLGLVLHPTLIRSRQDFVEAAKLFAPIACGGIIAIYALGVALGYSTFDWTPAMIFFPWALKNIVFTVLAEEVFFRGIVQREFASRLSFDRAGDIAVVVGGALFGVAHFSGGIYYVVLSSFAGILYGYTYKLTGRIEAPIITHFALNAGHFLIFTYPYSAV